MNRLKVKRNRHDNALFSPASLEFGKIHLMILKAAQLMDSRRWTRVKKTGRLVSEDLTDFGKEIGLDEIHWWVFKQETNVEELRRQTERVLSSAGTLKIASAKLSSKQPPLYKDLLVTLREFAEVHVREAQSLLEYVRWLEERDPMAPRILFTYRVWGSTRMSDRRIDIAPDAPLTDNLIQTCTEIVLGVRMDGHRVYDEIHNELAYEIYDSMDPEQLSYAGEISAPESRVVRATARAIYHECANYFLQLRDSLRHILIEIEKFEEQRNILHSDAFWRRFILKVVHSKKTETQLWDFKETLTLWHIKPQPQRDQAKVDFAKTIASFANARGGVLIVGVNDQHEIVGVGGSARDLENRLKTVSDVIARHVQYDRDIILLRQVAIPIGTEDKVCVVVIVAQTRSTVGVHDGHGQYTYPVRRETGTERVSASDISARKAGLKSDNHDFMIEFKMFVREN